MGLRFSKEMILTKEQIVPPQNRSSQLTPLQEKLIKKLGENNNVFPFTFRIPQTAPPSVTLQQTSEEDDGKPLGVEYEIKAFVADNDQDPGHKRSSVSLRIRKVQFADLTRVEKQPSTLVSKGFVLSNGKLNLEVTLNRDIYYHGEEIGASVHISNSSKKSVKNIKVSIKTQSLLPSSRPTLPPVARIIMLP
jgi:arrestin-2